MTAQKGSEKEDGCKGSIDVCCGNSYSAVNKCESRRVRIRVRRRVIFVERIRLVVCDVVVGFAKALEKLSCEVFEKTRKARRAKVREESVEEARTGSHYIPSVVIAYNAFDV